MKEKTGLHVGILKEKFYRNFDRHFLKLEICPILEIDEVYFFLRGMISVAYHCEIIPETEMLICIDKVDSLLESRQ